MKGLDLQIELRHLRYFVAVAEELHFGRAAKRVGIAQPPLSQQIKRLERLLKVTLFLRTSRRVELTDAGKTLLHESRLVLDAMERSVGRTRRTAAGELGTLAISFAESVMFQELPSLIREFRKLYPQIRLDLRELSTGAQLEALRSGDLDIGFVRDPAPDPNLLFEAIASEPLVLALSSSHPLVQSQQQIRLVDLADENFVLFPREVAPGLYDQVMALCRRAGFAPRVIQESRERPTTINLVEAGVGVTILPAPPHRLAWTGVVYAEIDDTQPCTQIVMVSRRDARRPVVAPFLELARSLGNGLL